MRKTNNTLLQNSTHLLSVLESFPDVIENLSHAFYVVNKKWEIIYINKQAESLLQAKRHMLLGKNMWKIYPHTKKTAWYTNFIRARRTMKPVHFDSYSTRLNKWFTTHAYPTEEGLFIFFADITERKMIEQKNEFQSNILTNITNSIIVTDRNGIVTYWNSGAEIVFGYSSGEMIGKTLEILYPQTAKQYYSDLRNVREGKEYIGEWKGKRKDGSEVWLDIKTTPLRSAGKITGFIGVATDITKRKQYEEDLLKFKAISENAYEGFSLLDREGRFLYENKARSKMLGYTESELRSMNLRDVDKAVSMKRYRKVFDEIQHMGPRQFEKIYTRKDGTTFPVEISIATVYLENKPYMLSVTRDITERKEAEKRIREGREQIKLITDNVPVLISYVDKQERYQFINKECEVWFGYSREHVIGKKVRTVIGEQSYKKIRSHIKKALAGERVTFEEFLHYRVEGDHYVLGNYIPHKKADGTVLGYFALVHDISDRRRIEENQQFLSMASVALSSPVEYNKTLQDIAQIAVPNLADWCAIQMFRDQENVEVVALAHKNPLKVAWAKAVRKVTPLQLSEKYGIRKIVKTGKSLFFPRITDSLLRKTVKSHSELRLIQKIGVTSVIVVPIKHIKKVVGGIVLVSAESNREFTKADVHTAEQLAASISLSFQNARLYQAIENERERINKLVANVPGVVWEAWGKPDLENQRIDFVSNHVEKMLGYSVNEWLATPNFWLKIVHPDDQKRAADEAALIFASGESGISRFRWVTKTGDIRWIEAQSKVIKDEKGNPIGMRGVTMDISERMEQERRKDDFISMASHELKTPVTSLKVYTQLMHRQAVQQRNTPFVQTLEKMDTQIVKLTNLIYDLLDLSRIQAGKLEYREEYFDINELVEEIVESIQATYSTHKITITGRIPKDVYADRDRIGQVLINLIINAIKYSPKADKVTIRLSNSGSKVQVTVRDYGIGIAKIQQEKIFDRFYQVTDNPEKTFPGLGIGLYISGEIIKRHKGRIWVDSEKGKGSTFSFILPLREKKN
jgi:PAS domain S-box-containing protein